MPDEANVHPLGEDQRSPTCGADNRVSPPIARRGWLRCAYCGAAFGTEEVVQTIEGPKAHILIKQRLGRYHFTIPAGSFLNRWTLFGGYAACAVISLRLLTEAELRFNGAALWLAAGAALTIGALLAILLFRRYRSEQHLELSPKRALLYHQLEERQFGKNEYTVQTDSRAHRVNSSVRLRPVSAKNGTATELSLRCGGPREARWLERFINYSLTHSKADGSATVPDEKPCPSCGAPLELSPEVRGKGYLNCPFCSAGFLFVWDRLEWEAAQLPLSKPRSSPGDRSEEELAVELIWQQSEGSLGLCFATCLVAFPVLLATLHTLQALLSLGTEHARQGNWAATEELSMGLFALISSALLLLLAAYPLFGRRQFKLGARTISHGRSFLGRTISTRAVALARIVKVEVVATAWKSTLLIHTPTDTLSAVIPFPSSLVNIWIYDELLPELHDRVVALGRNVSYANAHSPLEAQVVKHQQGLGTSGEPTIGVPES